MGRPGPTVHAPANPGRAAPTVHALQRRRPGWRAVRRSAWTVGAIGGGVRARRWWVRLAGASAGAPRRRSAGRWVGVRRNAWTAGPGRRVASARRRVRVASAAASVSHPVAPRPCRIPRAPRVRAATPHRQWPHAAESETSGRGSDLPDLRNSGEKAEVPTRKDPRAAEGAPSAGVRRDGKPHAESGTPAFRARTMSDRATEGTLTAAEGSVPRGRLSALQRGKLARRGRQARRRAVVTALPYKFVRRSSDDSALDSRRQPDDADDTELDSLADNRRRR